MTQISSPNLENSHRLLREACGRVLLPNRVLIELGGNDAKGWLQGQVTNDLRNLQLGGFMGSCLCKSTGQLEAILSLWSLPNRLILIGDQASAAVLAERVKKMVILEEVHIEDRPMHVLYIQGPRATETLSQWMTLPQLSAGETEMDGVPVTVLRSNRSGYGGWVVALSATATEQIATLESALPVIEEEAYRVACLENGAPQFGVDTDAKTLLPELGTAFESNYISYKKGCYLGQEVLMRIHSRGQVQRKWMGLFTNDLVEPGDRILHPRRSEVGIVTSAADSPDHGYIAAGFIRREVAYSGEIVTIETARGPIEAELQEMPILHMG